MNSFSYFKQSVTLMFFVSLVMTWGCASTPQALVPSTHQVQGLAVVPQTEAGEKILGGKQPRIIQESAQQAALFSALEMNKTDAPVSSVDLVSHDFVVKWKLRNNEGMDRSQLYLRLDNPRAFIYQSDLGGTTKKYVIKMEADDARTVWNAIGITPPGLGS